MQQELRDLVDQMMYQNIWYDEFLPVLDPQSPWPDDALPAFEKALQHVGSSMPGVTDANRLLVERLLRPVAEERIDPIDGLNQFMSLLSDPTHAHQVSKLKAEIVDAARAA